MYEMYELSAGTIPRAATKEIERLCEHVSAENHRSGVFVLDDGAEFKLVGPVYRFVVAALEMAISDGGVTLVPSSAELSTSQVAALLNVSRPHVVKLLEGGEIPFHKTGTHRRVMLSDALAFRARRDQQFESAMNELNQLSNRANFPR